MDRIKFSHASLEGPPLRTVKRAIKAGYLSSWPDLSINAINNVHGPDYTILGHIDRVRKNKLSAKSKDNRRNISEWDLTLETHVENKTHDFSIKVIDIRDTIYADQTGKFACSSKRGNNHIFVAYAYDLNAILV